MQCITMRIDARHQSRHWYQSMSRTPIRDALKRLSSAPANPSIRHSRESGNPRANIPRKNANCDTTTYVHAAPPLRLSGPLIRHWYENALKRLSSAPANPSIRHSREGGNPRANIPRKNANRDTTTYVHAAPHSSFRPPNPSLVRKHVPDPDPGCAFAPFLLSLDGRGLR